MNADLYIFFILLGVILLAVLVRLVVYKISALKKNDILFKYKVLRKKSLAFMEEFSMYMLSNQSEKEIFTADITFEQYYRYLKNNHVANLSSKMIEKFQNSNNLIHIAKTNTMLSEQETKLKDAENLIAKFDIHHI